ncbi:MAG: fluoride efflux transporter CrcB [Rubrivivax sp.]|nr:fluoride efflux transporter CrcB [Rubrivivax sp.]
MNLPLGAVAAVGIGGALGALLRYGLGSLLNALSPTLPPGTLVANLLGGYLVGVAVVFFTQHGQLPPEWRLLVITGFLGGLTTFSTFSAEVMHLLQAGRTFWALVAMAAHLAGSLLATWAGMLTAARLWRA